MRNPTSFRCRIFYGPSLYQLTRRAEYTSRSVDRPFSGRWRAMLDTE